MREVDEKEEIAKYIESCTSGTVFNVLGHNQRGLVLAFGLRTHPDRQTLSRWELPLQDRKFSRWED